MATAGTRKQSMGTGYLNNPMSAFANKFNNVTRNILQENGVDLYTETVSAFLREDSIEALREFFVEESADPESMTAMEYEEHVRTMNEQFENDKEAILENAGIGSFNPVVGLSLPMHKNLLMQEVFANGGGVPKVVALSPKFPITMEQRIFVDKEGREIDMFTQQAEIKKAMDRVNPYTAQVLAAPGVYQDLLTPYTTAKAGIDHISIDLKITSLKVANATVTTAVEVPTNIEFTTGYGDFDRMAYQSFKLDKTVVEGLGEEEAIEFELSAFVKGDTVMYMVAAPEGTAVSEVTVSTKLDTSSATLPTCSVKWKEKTSVVEIPSATPINVTVSPEEVKDVQKLYNVNQLSKIMTLIKDGMGSYKDDTIKDELAASYATMPADQKIAGQFDFKPRTGYAHDHVTWRQQTFFDALETYVTDMLQVLNDPNMTVVVYGRPDIIRKILPTQVTYQTPDSIGPVDLEYSKTVFTSNKRVYNFISSQKLTAKYGEARPNDIIIILKPRNSERIIYRVYDYQLYISNDIRNQANPSLPAIHAFDRWKFVSYQPVQGRIEILNPTGL